MTKAIIDTNIFLRFLTADIPTQHQKSEKIFTDIENGRLKGLVSVLVINELIWIMDNFYHLKRSDYLPALCQLLSLKNITIIEYKKNRLLTILEELQSTLIDFTDLYLHHQSQNQTPIATFDKDFQKLNSKLLKI